MSSETPPFPTRGSLAPGRLHLEGRRSSLERVRERHAGAAILDVTSRGPEPWLRFSPFFPHGGIPVPGMAGKTAASVEGIWQALKVFEHEDCELTLLEVTSMRGLERGGRARGRVLGHRLHDDGGRLLPLVEARRRIYLPAYRFVLEDRLGAVLEELVRMTEMRDVVLLDYETNADVDDPRRPLSHAALLRYHLEGSWPREE